MHCARHHHWRIPIPSKSRLLTSGDALIIGARWTVLSDLSVRFAITPAPRQSRASQGTWTFALRRPIYRALRDSEPLAAASRLLSKKHTNRHLPDLILHTVYQRGAEFSTQENTFALPGSLLLVYAP
jgi:hypothetical protein